MAGWGCHMAGYVWLLSWFQNRRMRIRVIPKLLILVLGISVYGTNRALASSPYIVNSTGDAPDADPSDGVCDTGVMLGAPVNAPECTLRAAIEQANDLTASPGLDSIHFNIDNTLFGAAPHTIQPTAALFITDPAVIDGTTEPDFADRPIIELDGSAQGEYGFGLYLYTGSDGSTVHGLVINRFWAGIIIDQASDTIIEGNYIGTDVSGTIDLGNYYLGIGIVGSNNTIGGTTPGAGNVISGNDGCGIYIDGEYDSSTSGNVVLGNYIGTNANGDAALGNVRGVCVVNAPNNTIGGAEAGAGNVISGNYMDGVRIVYMSASGNVVLGNYIGTNASGDAAISNAGTGVMIEDAPNNTVGGTVASARNLISGNTRGGIYIGEDEYGGTNANGNLVQGNYIGTNASGDAAIGNILFGVWIGNGSGNIIGGAVGTTPGAACTGACNLISGNDYTGIVIQGSSATENVVQGNHIGTDATGVVDLGNGSDGIQFLDGTFNNTIGGETISHSNLIAFNGGNGVLGTVWATSLLPQGNAILNNIIHSNGGLGIDLNDDGVTPNDVGAGDGDAGPNGLQNYPVLAYAATDGTSTTIVGTLDSAPGATFSLRFFTNNACDPSGYGEGKTFLGAVNVVTDGSGIADFNVNLPDGTPEGSFVTATATDPSNNTSEFSACQVVFSSNLPPTAGDDAAATDEDVSVEVDVLANDDDPDGAIDATTVAVTSGPGNGSTAVDPVTGAITYTPDADFFGTDSFTYTVDDDEGTPSNAATVTITVNPVDDPVVITASDPPGTNVVIPPPDCRTFSVTVHEVDGDTLAYTWLVDDVEVGTDPAYEFCMPDLDPHAVRVVVSDGISTDEHIWVVTAPPPPAAPTNLTAAALSWAEISLAWDDNASDETSYRIERSPDGVTAWAEIGTVGAGAVTFQDGSLTCATTYYYRVRAHRSEDNRYSDYSTVASATTLSCPIVGPLVYQGHTVSADSSIWGIGNDDGIVNCGETINLFIELANQGEATATGASATISTADPYVTLLNATSSYLDIPGGDTGASTDPYTFVVGDNVADGHVIHFELDSMMPGGGPWQSAFDVPVVCPCYSLTTQVTPGGIAVGSVAVSPAANCPGQRYLDGTDVTLTAVPNPQYRLVRWSGDVAGNQNPITVIMTAPRLVSAHFAAQPAGPTGN
jgi:CSLREA domain-containing protein